MRGYPKNYISDVFRTLKGISMGICWLGSLVHSITRKDLWTFPPPVLSGSCEGQQIYSKNFPHTNNYHFLQILHNLSFLYILKFAEIRTDPNSITFLSQKFRGADEKIIFEFWKCGAGNPTNIQLIWNQRWIYFASL